jgi:hypothetical protein
MKIFSAISAFLLFFAATCNNSQDDLIELTGNLEATGMTSYQYGSHTLTTADTFYALKSGSQDLTAFEGKKVRIKGEKVEGYPVDGGPEYIEVKEISEEK